MVNANMGAMRGARQGVLRKPPLQAAQINQPFINRACAAESERGLGGEVPVWCLHERKQEVPGHLLHLARSIRLEPLAERLRREGREVPVLCPAVQWVGQTAHLRSTTG